MEMTHSGITLCSWNSSAHSAGNTRFISPDLCSPNSLVDPETRSTTEFGNWCRNSVHCTKHKFATPATWCRASVTHGQACHKMSKLLVN